MPYTNTQHPSSTRTTVTIVMSIIFGISIIPTTVFGAAGHNQISYTIRSGSPSTPATLTFTGTGLKKGDKIRILAEGQVAQGGLCPTSSLPNMEYTCELENDESGTTTTIFSIPTNLVAAATGKVCYSHLDSAEVWTPVFQTPKKTPLYFSLENADIPTLYQEVRVKIRKGPTASPQFVFEETDKVYFVERAKHCTANPTACVAGTAGTTEAKICNVGPARVTLWNVVMEKSTDETFAMATVIIKGAEFTVGKTYKICYIKPNKGTTGKSKGTKVYEASSTLMGADTPVSINVLSSMFNLKMMEPGTLNAGQGAVVLSIAVAVKVSDGRALGNREDTQRPYLIPCPSGSCTTEILTVADKDRMAALCSRTGNQGTVTTGVLKGLSTDTLTTTFSPPATAAGSYGVCVPYCFTPSKCKSAISWALVNSNTPINILQKPVTGDPPPSVTKPVKPLVKEGDKDVPSVNKTTALSATAISSAIPAVLITSVVFLYLYNW